MKPTLYALAGALAAVLITTTSALAGSGVGGVFNLGQVNTVNQKTTLTGATADAELIVQNTGTGTALNLIAGAGAAPFKVNSSAKVTSLNADLLDGIDGSKLWKLGGNAGTIPGTNFLGTTDNKALELKVNGKRALRIEPAASPNLVGGYSGNVLDSGHLGSVIAGGGASGNVNHILNDYGFIGAGFANQAGTASAGGAAAVVAGTNNVASGGSAFIGAGGANQATANYAFVGAGQFNKASAPWSTVAGGDQNTAGDFIGAASYSTVGGGRSNTAGARYSTVAGGHDNRAAYDSSTVSGGRNNLAVGDSSTVAGGHDNLADGDFSFAAGSRAKAHHDGSFVWADSRNFDWGSPAENHFSVRSTGGVWFASAIDPTTGASTAGVSLSSGGGSWGGLSDRNAKEGFRTVDKQALLRRLAGVPVTRWSYKAQDPSIVHMGPTAQDFARAFGLGEDNRHITTIDADGVALAAIQGLYRQNQALEQENRGLRGNVGALRAQLKAQDARLRRLERAFSARSR